MDMKESLEEIVDEMERYIEYHRDRSINSIERCDVERWSKQLHKAINKDINHKMDQVYLANTSKHCDHENKSIYYAGLEKCIVCEDCNEVLG
jgi:hypothetical protein